ncbi:hypothetical protein [Maribacter sp. 2308TA10-17]|uniref:hypothetical protein n=1 Tax=Maribacter sp. 2308TA10-17 TaxID=3386276 RepID=UPI0039BD59F6
MKKLALLFHFILVLFLTGTQLSFAQSFPVQVIPQALPPAPIYFSDYADESTITSPLRVQLILNDLQVASKEVRLKASFEGNGIAFESNAIVSGAPLLFLESGIPLNLTNVELAPYFKFENIVGISPNVYGQPIPEGTYRFCFEVFDAFSGNRISDRTCAGTVIFQNDPPILISPLNKSIVEERNPQNIVFQWTPRHINVSNVEYELSIVEIWDNQIDHQAAFLSSPPIFQTTIPNTTYVYGPADPQLLSDKNYAWRVQAKAKQGTEEIGLFKNQGYSTIFVFGNTGICDLPIGINHEVKGATNANIFWDDITSESPEFQIRYRETGGDKEWFYSKTTANLVTIWDLEAGTEYEYQLAKTCALAESEYSPIKTFRTHLFDDDDSAYECGIAPNIDVTNETPLANLNTGEKFTAGDFPVTILEVNGSNGYFNGKGYVTIPYLKSIKVAVEFTNIFINELRELKQGNVITLYDPSLKGIVDPWDTFDDLDDIINGGDFTVYQPVDFDIDSVEINGDQITIRGTDADGNPTEVIYNYDSEDRYQITGTNGVFSIDENGNLNPLGPEGEGGPVNDTNTTGVNSGGSGTADDPSVATFADNDVIITYDKDSAAKYGWDEATSSYEKEQYPKVSSQSGSTFYPIHKAVKNGDTDTFYVNVDIKKDGLAIEDLIFKTVNGLEIKTEAAGTNRLKVTVAGSGGYRSEEAVITYKEGDEKQVAVSSFFIHHLRPRGEVNVTLIPVNGYAPAQGIENQVKNLFDIAAANLKIAMGAAFNGDTSGLQYTESGLLSKHPDSFKQFYTDFKNNYSGYSSDTYYVFLFDQSVQPGQNLAGFMPRGTQFGYVFSANVSTTGLESKQTLADVVAHEIGHGVLGISHPADNDLDTDWLMDKGKGNQLAKRDWEAIGDAGIQLYLFDDDGDGEFAPIVIRCLSGATIDFAFYYTSIWVMIQIDDQYEGDKPSFAEFGKVKDYKDFSWGEAATSAAIACGAANAPSFLAPDTSRKLKAGLAALGGAATGFATETAKQYEITIDSLSQANGRKPKLKLVVRNINWQPIIINSVGEGVLVGFAEYLISSKKLKKLKVLVEEKLGKKLTKQNIPDFVRFIRNIGLSKVRQRLLDRLSDQPNLENWINTLNNKKLLEKLETLDDDTLKLLDGDITNVNLQNAFDNNPELINAWDFVRDATGIDSAKKISVDILKSVSKHLDDLDFMNVIGSGNVQAGKNAFGELIKKYTGKCQACTGGNPSKYLPDNPQEYIDKVVELTKRYSDKNGIDIFKEAKKGFASQDGAWHSMKHIDGLDPSKVRRIDAKFEGEGLPCEGCRFDVELIPTSSKPLKLLEYKSYLNASKIPLPQFKNYLNDVTNLNQFNYIFNKSKLNLADAQDGLENFLNKNAIDLFKTPANGGIGLAKMKQLFEFDNFVFDNVAEFKNLLSNNKTFRDNALSFVKTN